MTAVAYDGSTPLVVPPLGTPIQEGVVRALKVAISSAEDLFSAVGTKELFSLDASSQGSEIHVLAVMAYVTEAWLTAGHTASGSAVTLHLGDGTDPCGFAATADIVPETVDTGGLVASSLGTAQAYSGGKVYSADDTIDLKIAGGVPSGSGGLEVTLLYTAGLA